jgi:transcription termination factor Rho
MGSHSNDIVTGLLELTNGGSGALRDPLRDCQSRPTDPVISPQMVRQHHLRGGESVAVAVNRRRRNSGAPHVRGIVEIDGFEPDDRPQTKPIEQLTAVNPDSQLRFETPGGPVAMRIIDLMTPIGAGQRGLIVAPPRTGKTTLLQQIAHAMATNYPDMELIVLLVDERPEEVTDIRRSVQGQVFASSKDREIASHVRLAKLVIERAKRLAELGRDVCLLLDSLTRLGRAFNAHVGTSGRTLSGGLDIRALEEPKQIFGAARNIENGGSLTIIASALIETGSRADEFIFQEFKGTGNMELVLSRELANLRIWPAVDLSQSGTRKEELLLSDEAVQKTYRLRRVLSSLEPVAQMQTLLQALQRFETNEQFLREAMI